MQDKEYKPICEHCGSDVDVKYYFLKGHYFCLKCVTKAKAEKGGE